MLRIFFITTFSVIFLISCDFTEVGDQNPNSDLASLLKSSQINMAQLSGGTYVAITSMLTQQISGTSQKLLQFDRYSITSTDSEIPWQIGYLHILANLNNVVIIGEERNYPKVSAMAYLMMAHTVGLITDVMGNMPFSKSFLTNQVELRPTYDSQEEIYTRIINLIDLGLLKLESSSDNQFPVEEDVFFLGNINKWRAYGNFLKIKYSLHLSKRFGYSNLIGLINSNLFSHPSDTLAIDFSKETAVSSPLFFFLQSINGSVNAGNKIVEMMKMSNDPRLPVYFKLDNQNNYSGSIAGSGNGNCSTISNLFTSSKSVVILASYVEQKFIEAEIHLMNNSMLLAINAYNEALRSSLLNRKVWNETWFNANKAIDNLTLEQIINAKYVALFLQPEVWVDWRRTGFPTLESALNNYTSNVIPRRFPYPQSEYNFNSSNVPQGVEITHRLWWDILQ